MTQDKVYPRLERKKLRKQTKFGADEKDLYTKLFEKNTERVFSACISHSGEFCAMAIPDMYGASPCRTKSEIEQEQQEQTEFPSVELTYSQVRFLIEAHRQGKLNSAFVKLLKESFNKE